MFSINQREKKVCDDIESKCFGRVVFIGQDKNGQFDILQNANLTLDNLYSHIINCLREGTAITQYIEKISLGRGGHSAGDDQTPIPPFHTDVALDDEIDPPGKKLIASRQSATSYEVEFNTTFFDSEANERISEAGLWLNDDTLVCRVTFPAFEKTSLLNLIVRWFLYYTI